MTLKHNIGTIFKLVINFTMAATVASDYEHFQQFVMLRT